MRAQGTRSGSACWMRGYRLLGAAATLLALGVGPVAAPAGAETVLSQNWETGLASQIPSPSTKDPLTGRDDQWLTFAGGFPHVGGEGGEPAQGVPDTEEVGADGLEGWPAAVPFDGDGGIETVNSPVDDRHNLWHVQADPQDLALNPFITANLVTLPPGDDGALPSPTSGSHVAWFGSESSGSYCGTLEEIKESSANQPGSESGCDTKEDPEELPGGGAGAGDTVEEGELVSPPFSLENATSAVLHLNSWFEVEGVEANVFDVMEIDYTTDEGTQTDPFTWHEVGTLNPEDDTAGASYEDYTDEGLDTPSNWQPILADLSPAIGRPHVRVRFVFDTWDVLYNGFRGWLIDDVSVATPSDAGAPSITGVDVCAGASVAPVTVIHGSNFFVGSTVDVDGVGEAAQTPSSTRVEIPPIAPGTHTIQVVDPDGSASNVFVVDQPSSCEPPPAIVLPPSTSLPGFTSAAVTTTTPLAPSPPPSPPKLAVSADVAPVSGSVLIKLPGSSTFVPLTAVGQIPFGTVIDATHGRVKITTAGPHGGTQTGEFFEGEFVLTQGRSGLVVATLTGGSFAVCPTARERSHMARASSSHASGKHVVRKLWTNAHGSFSTRGNYAAATVRGTEWLTEDLCEGTLIRVTRDKVAVTDLVNHRRVTVKAGRRFLAKAP